MKLTRDQIPIVPDITVTDISIRVIKIAFHMMSVELGVAISRV